MIMRTNNKGENQARLARARRLHPLVALASVYAAAGAAGSGLAVCGSMMIKGSAVTGMRLAAAAGSEATSAESWASPAVALVWAGGGVAWMRLVAAAS